MKQSIRTRAIKEGAQTGRAARFLLLRDQSGAALVEFALIVIPFLSLLFMIIQQGLFFFENESLQTAISESGRLIATGQASNAAYTQEQFRQQVCARLPPLLSCSSLSIDVRTYASFSAAGRFRPYDANGNYTPSLTIYNPGAQGSIVVVSGFSLQRVLFPMLNVFFKTAGSGQVVLTANAAFRNEPY